MHVLSKRAPNTRGPGMAPKILMRSFWSPNAYDCWPVSTLLKGKHAFSNLTTEITMLKILHRTLL